MGRSIYTIQGDIVTAQDSCEHRIAEIDRESTESATKERP